MLVLENCQAFSITSDPTKEVLFVKKMYCILCLLFCLQFITSSAEAGPLQPGLKERCPVCGMYVAPYPHWIASITFQDGTSVYFGGRRISSPIIFILPIPTCPPPWLP
jgi:hypothetical protein